MTNSIQETKEKLHSGINLSETIDALQSEIECLDKRIENLERLLQATLDLANSYQHK